MSSRTYHRVGWFAAGLLGLAGLLWLAGSAGAQWDEAVDLAPALGPKRMAEVLHQAKARRMSMERDQVAVEIREGLLFDPDKVELAIKQLMHKPEDSWEDNARRICRAFALVDARFGRAWSALEKGRWETAAQAVKPLISKRDTSYLAAAKRFCYAESLAGMGRSEDAAEAYTDLVKVMPDRFSFSALALLRAAQTYERMNRRLYAASLYRVWVDNFGLLDPKKAEELTRRYERIAAEYKDPLGALSSKMSDVEKRLASVDSGRTTQQKQREIVAMLDDLIAAAEENSRGQGQGQSQGQKQEQGQGQGQDKGKRAKGKKGQGKGRGRGVGRGPAMGVSIPSSPATVSRLVGGPVLKPRGLSEIRPSDPSDDWGRLPPEQRRKLLETFKEQMPERYRRMIGDYYRRLASEPTR